MAYIDREARYFKKVPEQIIANNSIDYSQAAKQNLPNLEEPVYIFTGQNTGIICLKSTKETRDYTFPTGKYAYKHFMAENEAMIEIQIEQFSEELKYPAKNMLIYENIYPSLAYPNAMVYTMEVQI